MLHLRGKTICGHYSVDGISVILVTSRTGPRDERYGYKVQAEPADRQRPGANPIVDYQAALGGYANCALVHI